MSDSESDGEVFFKTTEVTGQKDLTSPQQLDTKRLSHSHGQMINMAYTEQGSQNEFEQENNDTPSISMENAVKDMVNMQNQMSQALQSVATLLTDLCKKDQGTLSHEYRETNNNHFCNTHKNQGDSYSAYRNQAQNQNDPQAETENNDIQIHTYNRPPQRSRPHFSRQCNNSIKLPAFTGKDEWKVWINRFETIAERQEWDDDQKLDNLLPKLQGSAGEFVFTQLKHHTLKNYRELVRELNSRFRVIETPRTFAAKFSRRDQKNSETAEEYAAELKRLYDKAHNRRDSMTRTEDLVRRFLDGLKDEEVRWEVEYIKEPEDIDEAVYHVLNYIQARKRHMFVPSGERKKRFIRRMQTDESSDSESYDSNNEEDEHIYRVPMRNQDNKHKPGGRSIASQNDTKVKETKDMKTSSNGTSNETNTVSRETEILQQVLEKLNELTQCSKSSPGTQKSQWMQKTVIRCYSCNQENHYARDCPMKHQGVEHHRYENQGPRQCYGHNSQNQGQNSISQGFNQNLDWKGPSRKTYPEENTSNVCIRRVSINNDTKKDTREPCRENMEGEENDIPGHSRILAVANVCNQYLNVKQTIAKQVKDSFSINDLDQGQKTLIEHLIYAGATPVKQPPGCSNVASDSVTATEGRKVKSHGEYIDIQKTRMRQTPKMAREHLNGAKRHKTIYDAKISVKKYRVGDVVWCLAETRKPVVGPKLERTYKGPFLVSQAITDVNFILKTDQYGKEKLVHHNKLKPYEGTEPPKWMKKAKQRLDKN